MNKSINDSRKKSLTQHELLESKYNRSVSNILIVVVFSLINVILLVVGSESYFLFSAFIPYFIADYGMFFCGMYPEEYYYDMQGIVFADKSTLVFCLVIVAVILLVYFLCWLFAKKKKVAWLTVALILFVIDTVAMLVIAGVSVDMIIDIVFHAWVIISLISGIVNYNKLKKLPEEPESVIEVVDQYENTQNHENTGVIRMADNEVKARVFLEANVPGYYIVYRRVKRTNELVVNGRVYDEYEALVELPHTLTALIDGHKIEVGYDDSSHMYIFFDGEQVAKKLRLI